MAVIGGDGTGPEVAAEGLKVLAAVAKLEKFEVGGPGQETRLMSPVYSEDIALVVRSTSQTKR